MSRPARILLAGGGTGGHVYPAIAIADALRRADPESAVAFAGTTDRMEWEAVPKAGYPIYPIAAAGFNRSRPLSNAALPAKVLKGLGQSFRLIGDFDADAVVGTGGFVAGPVGLAAWMRRRPLVLQEQNAYAGITNRMLGKLASQVHVAFSEALGAFPEGRATLSGNPVRAGLGLIAREDARAALRLDPGGQVLFVFGGSLGSQALNEALLAQIDRLMSRTAAYLMWQTGPRYYDRVRAAVPDSERIRVLRYVDNMAEAYAAADLALSRSGASTCSELLVTGTPAILVPSPNVAEDHQTHNARSMVAAGAAEILPEEDLMESLVPRVAELLEAKERLWAMRDAAGRHAVRDSADRIAASVMELAQTRRAA